MQLITVKIQREPVGIRRSSHDTQPSPDLLIQVRDNGNLADGLERAIRLLNSERDAIVDKIPVQKGPKVDEEPDEDDEDDEEAI